MVALAGASLPDHNRATYEYDENSNLTLEKTNTYTYFNYHDGMGREIFGAEGTMWILWDATKRS